MGTAEYMAPEQARSADAVDARADLYAVGVMLYEMIAGARPVRGDSGEDARVIALKVERGEVDAARAARHPTRRASSRASCTARWPRAPRCGSSTATEMRLALEGAIRGKQAAGAHPMPSAQGSGTVAMAAGAAGAFGVAAPFRGTEAVPMVNGPDIEPPVDTLRAAPIATALAPMAYAGSPMTAGAAPVGFASAPRRRQGVPIAALIGLSLLLGASVVGILIGTGTLALSSAPPEPPAVAMPTVTPGPTIPPPSAPAAPSTTPAATGVASPPAIPTLTPSRPTPAPPRPAPTVKPPQDAADAGPAPFSFPTALPPFPSGFPLPAGFPTTFPSGFPTSLPGWPTLPVPLPGPNKQPAPSSSSGY